jgi:hypothetical protein
MLYDDIQIDFLINNYDRIYKIINYSSINNDKIIDFLIKN